MKSAMQWMLAMHDPVSGWHGLDGDRSLADFIRDIQRDALESAIREAGCGHNDCMDESARRIRVLMPGTPPPRSATDEAIDKLRAQGISVGSTGHIPRPRSR